MIAAVLSSLLFTQAPAAPTGDLVGAPIVAPATPAATVPALGELHQAQIEAHLAKLRALQLEVQLQQLALSAQRDKLTAAIAAAHPGFRIDWEGGGVLVPAEPRKEPAK